MVDNTKSVARTKNKAQRYNILTEEERLLLIPVKEKLARFEKIYKTFITKQEKMKLNFMLLTGVTGVGKTHHITKWTNDLMEEGKIRNFDYNSGELTHSGFFGVLWENQEHGVITILDDCEVLDKGCQKTLDMLKAATDLRSKEKERIVTNGNVHGKVQFVYNGTLVIISNGDYSYTNNPHFKAVKRRMIYLNLEFTQMEMYVLNTHVVEQFVNTEMVETMTEDDIIDFLSFYQTSIKEWHLNGIFNECGIEFSLGEIVKLMELYTWFKDEWKDLSQEYQSITSLVEYKKSQGIYGWIRLSAEEADKYSWELIDKLNEKEVVVKEVDGEWFVKPGHQIH